MPLLDRYPWLPASILVAVCTSILISGITTCYLYEGRLAAVFLWGAISLSILAITIVFAIGWMVWDMTTR